MGMSTTNILYFMKIGKIKGCSMEKGIHEDVLYKQIKEVNYSDSDLLKLISDREKKGVVNDFVYKAYVKLAKERGLR